MSEPGGSGKPGISGDYGMLRSRTGRLGMRSRTGEFDEPGML